MLHGGGHVCAAGAAGARHAGGLRDGGGQGHEEGHRQEHVHPEALEVGLRTRGRVTFTRSIKRLEEGVW